MSRRIEHPLTGERAAARGATRSEAVRAAAFLSLLVAVFLGKPLSRDGVYAPTGILQHSALFRVEGDWRPPATNHVLHDPVSQMHPFLAFNRAELRAGRLPLWNPYNGHGAPHLANYQSAVFSPFSLPFYLLPWREALMVAAFAKLFLLGFLTWAFLRATGIGFWAALLGGTVFAFSGWAVVWLHWPHTAATVALPAMMLATERVLVTIGARRSAWLAGLAVAVGLGLLAGHPETMFFSLSLAGGYTLARLWGFLRTDAGRAEGRSGATAAAAQWAGAVLLGVGLAAVQLVPFVEYLTQSAVFAARGQQHELHALPVELAPLVAFPNLLGNPSKHYYDPVLRDGLNYNEACSHYSGLIALLLGALAVAGWRRHRARRVLFFAVVAVLWLLYAYDVAGLGRFAGRLPLLGLVVISRSQPVWLFAIAYLAAFGLNRVLEVGRRTELTRGGGSVAILLVAALLLATVAAGGLGLLSWAGEQPGNEVGTDEARSYRSEHVLRQGAGLLAAAGALAYVARRRRTGGQRSRFERAVPALVVILAFLETGYLLRAYNPTIEGRYFYPEPPQLDSVRAVVAGAPALWSGAAPMPPDVNLWYRMKSVGIYDAMSVRSYDRVYRRLLGAAPYLVDTRPRSLRALQAMGVHYLVTTGDPPWPPRRNGAPQVAGLEIVGRWGGISVYRVPDALPRFFTVGQAVFARERRALRALERRRFPIRERLLLHEAADLDHPARTASVERVTVLEERPGRVRLSVERDAAGWLAALITAFPGWRATVDGRPVPLRRANVAFCAVPLARGEHEVVLEYRPASVRVGLAVSGLSLVLLVAPLALRRLPLPAGRFGSLGRAWERPTSRVSTPAHRPPPACADPAGETPRASARYSVRGPRKGSWELSLIRSPPTRTSH
jgi:hypothetical protein